MAAFALPIGNGLTLAGQRWSSRLPSSKGLVVALHGWLDNSSSFSKLGSLLGDRGYDVAAVDLPGHGLSSHLSRDNGSSAHYLFPHTIAAVKRFVDVYTASSGISMDAEAKKPQLLCLLGHSMGAGISLMAAGAFPSLCSKVVLLDGFGPYARPEDLSCDSFRKAATAELRAWAEADGGRSRKRYSSADAAVEARLRAVSSYPGQQTMSVEAAQLLVARGTESSSDGTYFRHDPRLAAPSYNYYTHRQVDSFVSGVQARVLLLAAERGWPPLDREDYERRAGILSGKGLFQSRTLAGSHHFHLDDDSCGPVAEAVAVFLDH